MMAQDHGTCPVCGRAAHVIGGRTFHIDGTNNTACWDYEQRAAESEAAAAERPSDVDRVARLIVRHLAGRGRLTSREIRDRIAGRDKGFIRPARAAAAEHGWIVDHGTYVTVGAESDGGQR